ncbi:MAG TPA: LysR family transcriptional regulator, partial [Beijerinckiaceae bacterium]|nr:LysR family transcriptional regulator [Beijerinckiaceae bacterium]
MDLKRLEMFRTVARRGNLRLAAQQLGRTIPAVSMQIKKLEEEIGVQLFHHTRSKLLLNEQGRTFLAELENVFSSLERAKRLAVGGPHQTAASLSISLGGDLSIFFAARIAAFARAYPEVSITIVSGPTSRSLALVGNRECDIGIGFYRTVPRGLRRFTITETDITLVVPRGFRLRKGTPPALDMIAENRVIMLSRASETRRMIDGVFATQNCEPNYIIEVPSCRSAIEYVALGLGVGLVHGICACAENRRNVRQISMAASFGRMEVSLVTRPDILARPIHARFIEIITG